MSTSKELAQDALMHGMANAILGARENGTSADIIDSMIAEATKIGKRLGYVNWPGIYGA